MKKQKINQKIKISMAVLLIASALGSAGTFAWTSMSQRALNEGTMVHRPGGRIHDDYEGFDSIIPTSGGDVNKDVYAENYSTKPIFVRIKLSEYMETGIGAGNYTVEGADHVMTKTSDNKAVVFSGSGLDTATLADRTSWSIYYPNGVMSNGQPSAIRQHIKWTLGQKPGENKLYMPTFNQNNQDLGADVTGEGIDQSTWTKNTNYDTETKELTGKADQWSLGETHTSVLKRYDDIKNQEITIPETVHTAKSTVSSDHDGYMTMSEWITAGKPVGNFWVHDHDGWIYWASPLQGRTATSVLLNQLTIDFPEEDMYYAIDVTSDFATSDDLIQWTGVSTQAQDLLAQIQK